MFSKTSESIGASTPILDFSVINYLMSMIRYTEIDV